MNVLGTWWNIQKSVKRFRSELQLIYNTQYFINIIHLFTEVFEAEASGFIRSFDKQFLVITYCCELMKMPRAPAGPPAVRFYLFSFKHQPSLKKEPVNNRLQFSGSFPETPAIIFTLSEIWQVLTGIIWSQFGIDNWLIWAINATCKHERPALMKDECSLNTHLKWMKTLV